MKLLRLIALLAIATVPTALIAQTSNGPTLQISKENRTISITASDHAEADPDVADIHIGFTAYGPTLKAAYATASDTSNAIVKAMLDAGAAHSDIQSQSQRVSRLQDYEIKLKKGMKYSVEQTWTVSVEPSKAALILDAAVQAGANQSGDITWRMKNSVSLDAEAIHRATERAHTMASELAKSMGVTLGKPIFATNTVTGNFASAIMMNSMEMKMRDKSAPAPLAIEAQRVDRTATVQVIYAIE